MRLPKMVESKSKSPDPTRKINTSGLLPQSRASFTTWRLAASHPAWITKTDRIFQPPKEFHVALIEL
jgi:hypothetical protein